MTWTSVDGLDIADMTQPGQASHLDILGIAKKYKNTQIKILNAKTRLNAYCKHERGHEGSQPDILRIEGCIQHISAILIFLTQPEAHCLKL